MAKGISYVEEINQDISLCVKKEGISIRRNKCAGQANDELTCSTSGSFFSLRP